MGFKILPIGLAVVVITLLELAADFHLVWVATAGRTPTTPPMSRHWYVGARLMRR